MFGDWMRRLTAVGRLSMHWQVLVATVLGAGIGLALNFFAGTYESPGHVPFEFSNDQVQLLGMAVPITVPPGTLWVRDTPGQTIMHIYTAPTTSESGEPVAASARQVYVGILSAATRQEQQQQLERVLQAAGIPPHPQADAVSRVRRVYAPSLEELRRKDPAAYALFYLRGRSLGRAVGDANQQVGLLFLRMLKMVSVPLIIFSLLSGVVGLGGAERLGRMFGRTLLYYLCTSLLAIAVGLLMVNLIQPGKRGGAGLPAPPAVVQQFEEEAGKGLGAVLFEQLQNLIPDNPFQAVAEANFLSIIAFTLAFGIFTILAGGRTLEFIRTLAESGFAVMMRLTGAIILLAPLGVLCLMLYATATQGIGIFGDLGLYMLTVASALVLHAAVVLPLVLRLVARRSPWQYAQAMSPALFMAFSSSSSNATLPVTMDCVENRAGISNRTSSFVLPLGATINMDGTALYEAVAVLFIANFSGIDLTLTQQVIVAITALLASVGAAGIPQAGLVMMIIILQAVNLPIESQGLIIAVDRVLDMARTVVNVWSDACGCAVVERLEGEPSPQPAV